VNFLDDSEPHSAEHLAAGSPFWSEGYGINWPSLSGHGTVAREDIKGYPLHLQLFRTEG
jgi:hypothetical protein